MKNESEIQKIENEIYKRFDELKDNKKIVSENIDDSNFELKEILKFLGQASDKKVLDVGCGKGKFCRKIKDIGFDIIGVDPSKELIKKAAENNKDIKFIEASATSLPFSDSEFDFIICIEVLEHIPDTEKAIKEMTRVLKPQGRFLIIDKNIFSLHHRYFVPTIFWKKYMEITNHWMYPRNFPFKEKYFSPRKIDKIIKKYCSKSKINFIYPTFEIKNYSFGKKIILKICGSVSFLQHKILPFLDFFVAWVGEK